MTIDVSKAVGLIKVVQLQSVRLVAGDTKSEIPAGVTHEEVSADINFGGRPLAPPSAGTLLVQAGIEVLVRPGKDAPPIVTLHATFELQYSLPDDASPTREELATFASTNAVFNAWPYWREYVQSTFVRMNLPPLLLPVFRLENAGRQLKGQTTREGSKGIKQRARR